MNLAWKIEPIYPRQLGHSGLKNWAILAWNFTALLKSRPIWPENWVIWHGNIGKSNLAWKSGLEIQAYLAWKSRPIWPGFIGQYGQENPGNSDLGIRVNLAVNPGQYGLEILPILPGNPGQSGLKIWANVA